MADRGYLLDKPAPPSPIRVFIDQKIIPAGIDAAGSAEVALSQLAIATRKRPLAGIGLALSFGCLLAALAFGRKRRLYTA